MTGDPAPSPQARTLPRWFVATLVVVFCIPVAVFVCSLVSTSYGTRCHEALARHDDRSAQRLCSIAVAVYPFNVQAQLDRDAARHAAEAASVETQCQALVNAKRFHDAQPVCRQAVDRASGDPRAFVAEAQLFMQTGDYRSAAADCSTAIRLAPSDPNAYMIRAKASARLRDFKDAASDYQTAALLFQQRADDAGRKAALAAAATLPHH